MNDFSEKVQFRNNMVFKNSKTRICYWVTVKLTKQPYFETPVKNTPHPSTTHTRQYEFLEKMFRILIHP